MKLIRSLLLLSIFGISIIVHIPKAKSVNHFYTLLGIPITYAGIHSLYYSYIKYPDRFTTYCNSKYNGNKSLPTLCMFLVTLAGISYIAEGTDLLK